LEPGSNSAISTQRLRFNEPLAAIVGHERDARRALRRGKDRVEPVRLPSVVERIQQTRRMAMQMDDVRVLCRIFEADGDGLTRRCREQRTAESTSRPVPWIIERDIEFERGSKI